MPPLGPICAALAILALGCVETDAEESKAGGAPEASDDGDGRGGGGLGDGSGPADVGSCSEDAECVAASSSCCECPTFAVPSDQDTMGCDAVQCDEPADCGLLEPACSGGTCVLVCAPVVASQSCEAGFVRDADGCLLDECAPDLDASEQGECTQADDCVQVAADCCGCARGGEDTAVLADEAASFDAGLGCTGDEICPEVDVCDAEATVRCVAGGCALVAPNAPADPGEGDAMLCGTPALDACPEGQVCVLNARNATQADELAVGVCQGE